MMGMEKDLCNTGLNLGLCSPPTNDAQKPNKVAAAAAAVSGFEPYLTLSLSGDSCSAAYAGDSNKKDAAAGDKYLYGRQGSPHTHSSSFSSPGPVKVMMKRERERDNQSSDQEMEADDHQRGVNCFEEDDEVGVNNARKKLRLTKEQSALLEESFKHHSTLNPKQKQALARQLNLRPRQVEVWFQNRRARTKLKQTEVECELLKKCCENLTEENRRLQKEVQELKALKLGGAGAGAGGPPQQPPSFYMHVPSSATLTMCPSCQRITDGATNNSNNTPLFSSTNKPHHFYNPFINNPSAAF